MTPGYCDRGLGRVTPPGSGGSRNKVMRAAVSFEGRLPSPARGYGGAL